MTRPVRLSFRLFYPRSLQAEIDMLCRDDEDFIVTKYYIDGLIHHTLGRIQIPPLTRDRLHELLLDDVEIAARRFLKHRDNRVPRYKFSTYFSGYIEERLKKLKTG